MIGRRSGLFLLAFAAWNTFVWVTFVKNVYPDHHLDGFFLVHLGVGGLTTALGLGAGWIGWRALRAPARAAHDRHASGETAADVTRGAPAGFSRR